MMKRKNVQLLNWVKTATDDQISTARASRSYLRLIAYGHKHPSPTVAAGIELATNGVVTRQQMRPDDWSLIWPELVASAVPATPTSEEGKENKHSKREH